jgi:hypothetical protein
VSAFAADSAARATPFTGKDTVTVGGVNTTRACLAHPRDGAFWGPGAIARLAAVRTALVAVLCTILLGACSSAASPSVHDAGARADAMGHEAGSLSDHAMADGGLIDGASTDGSAVTDAGPARRYALATTGAQLVVTGPELGFQLTAADVLEDSDVVAIHQEFYGVPWDSFEQQSAPPAQWVALMDRFARATTEARKPVFLSISMLNGLRESLAAKTLIEDGQVKSEDDWAARCYDFATAPDGAAKKAAYLRYVAYMVDKLRPAYLNIAIEVNLFFEKCPGAVAGLIDVINAAYDAAKARDASLLVFPSIQIDHLYGYATDSCADAAQRDACFDAAYAQLSGMKRDRFAMSTYPYMANIATPRDLPADGFTRGPARGAEKALVAETGWPSDDIVVRARDGTCQPYFSFDELISAQYLQRVLEAADAGELELITWWSDRDLVVPQVMTDCPCDFDASWCAVVDIFRGPPSVGSFDSQLFGELLLKVFGTMGLRRYDGTPKLALQAWNEALDPPWVR